MPHVAAPTCCTAATHGLGGMSTLGAEAAPDGGAHAGSVEARLLARYGAGEEAAFDELVERYREQSFWVARHLTGNDEMANDVVQDAFVRLLRHHRRYDPRRSSFRAWFLQIVRNMAIDHLRKARIRHSQDAVEAAPDAAPQADAVENAELGVRIRAVLDTLPERYRQLIVLRDVEELGPQDIAAMTGADYGTTRWRIHNARKLFRQEWVRRYGDELP